MGNPKFDTRNSNNNSAILSYLIKMVNKLLKNNGGGESSPTLQQVTVEGNTTDRDIIVDSGSTPRKIAVRLTNFVGTQEVFMTSIGIHQTNGNGTKRLLWATSRDATLLLPNESGILVVDAPTDFQNYVRKNNTWVVAPTGGTPTLDAVLGAGNTSTNKVINMNLGSSTVAINVVGNTTNTFRTQIYPGGILTKNSSNQIVASMAVSGQGTTGVFQLINTTGAGIVQLRGDNLSVEVNNGGFGGTLVQSALFKDRLTFKQVGGLDCYIKPETVPYAATPEWTLPGAFGKLAVIKTTAPASATDVGVVGEIRVTPTFIYTCVAPNTWVRAAVTTW